MNNKLILAALLSALTFGSVAAEAHSGHHSYRHVRYFRHIHSFHHLRHFGYSHHLHCVRRAYRGARHLALFQPRPSNGLRDLVSRLAAENGVPYRLANAVVTIESRYNPHAANGGALGLMQIKAQTARGLGFQGTARGLLDPGINVQYGMRYLALAYHQSGGNLCATVMRYQSGTAARHMSRANRAYCSRASLLIGHG